MEDTLRTQILDWSDCPAVESIPRKFGGAWVFRNTRLPVAIVVENLEDLSSDEAIAVQFRPKQSIPRVESSF